MPDDIRTLSAALARDPGSLAYVELAEALRRKGQLSDAVQVATSGLARHPQHADGHDCLARIHADRGDLAQAGAAWERALAIAPEHPGALKGVGFVYWRQGDAKRAADALEHAQRVTPGDESIARALAAVRVQAFGHDAAVPSPAPPPPPSRSPPKRRATMPIDSPTPDAPPAPPAAAAPPRAAAAPAVERPAVFAGFEGATADILLLDSRGLVLAGGLRASDGVDVSDLAAAALAGVSGEASRTADYVRLERWTAIVAEAEQANVVLAPVGDGALLMVRRDRSTPVGLALRVAERARSTAQSWLEGQGA